MGAQDNTEKVLRALHVLLSKSEPYAKEPSKVIVDKQQILQLLSNLNTCIYQIMDEYELTKRSRDHAQREFQKQGDQIIWDASRKAEDIYAASVLYMDDALNRMQEIMREADKKVADIYAQVKEEMTKEERVVKANQMELKSQLQDLVDTEKYLKLIEERNRDIEKQKTEGKPVEQKERSHYANRQTAVRVNQEYLDKLGLSEMSEEEEEKPAAAEKAHDAAEPKKGENKAEEAKIRVDLDADYFQWKKDQEKEKEKKIPSKTKSRQRAQAKVHSKRIKK
jgi:hypothetical protein